MGGEYFYDCSAPSHDLQLQGIDVVGAMVSADAVYYMQCGWKANTSMIAALPFMTPGFKGIDVIGTVVSAAAGYYSYCGCKANTSMNAALPFMTLGFKEIDVVVAVVSAAAV
jgi:uncharacterized ParB-like nuclease family protein